MTTTLIEKPSFTLAGLSCRIRNDAEMGPGGQLPLLWDRYFKSGLAQTPGFTNPHLIYALYTDYESDASGAYTVVIGHQVGEAANQINKDSLTVSVPASKYLVFTTRRGPVFEVVAQTWGEIWHYFTSSSEERTFTGDFELYDGRSFNPDDAEVQIYIAVK